MQKRIALSKAAVMGALLGSAQQPFALDTAFRTNIDSWYVNSVAVMADSNLLVSGQIMFAGDMSFRGSCKLLRNGQRDMSFPTFPLTTGGGKIVPWNDKFYVNNGLVRRLLPSGYIDLSFIQMNTGPYFDYLQGGDYHVFADGRVIMSGLNTLSDTARGFVGNYNLIWFSNTGYLDTTRTHRHGNGAIYTFKEMPNGQFICNGVGTQFEGHAVDKIFRVAADGVLDTTFHTGVTWGIVGGFLPMADGRVYAAGDFVSTQAPGDTLRLVRFMQDGSLDPTFNIPQFTVGPAPTAPFGAVISGMYPWRNGQIIAYGTFQSVNGETQGAICLLDSTGQVMDTFNNCSVGPYTYDTFTYESIDWFIPNEDSTSFYICGAYNGYNDGVTNDPLQRFVTRLFAGDTSLGLGQPKEQEPEVLTLYPNPASGSTTVEFVHQQENGTFFVRDALCREVLHTRCTGRYTQLSLGVLNAGLYTVELFDGTQRVATEKLLVE